MTKVVADITMSLDGFVTGPNAGPKAGLGDDGMPLHDWVFNGHDVDEAVLANATQRSGAVVMGRNLFDVVDDPDGWSDEIGYGAHHVGRPSFFVVTHTPPAQVRLNLDFTFVTEGVAPALDAARRRVPARQRRRDHGRRQCDRTGNRPRSRRRDGAARLPNRDGRRHTALARRRAASATPDRCPGIAIRDPHHLRTHREHNEGWLRSACVTVDGVIKAQYAVSLSAPTAGVRGCPPSVSFPAIRRPPTASFCAPWPASAGSPWRAPTRRCGRVTGTPRDGFGGPTFHCWE